MAAGRTVVVLPGGSYGAHVPQLFFPMIAAMRRGAEPVPISWHDADRVGEMPSDQISGWVNGQIEQVLDPLDPAASLVIGKSLGSFAAGLVAELGLPAIWITPVMINNEIVAALRRTRSPFLLAGGTADRLWSSSVARDLTPHVVEIEDADHGLFDQGPLERSARNIGVLAAACETFMDDVVWPSERPSSRGV